MNTIVVISVEGGGGIFVENSKSNCISECRAIEGYASRESVNREAESTNLIDPGYFAVFLFIFR